jgi:hypothetical protein
MAKPQPLVNIMHFRTFKIALGRTACLIALLLGTGASLSYAQDGCSNPPPHVEATPGPTPTLAPPVWDAGLGIGVVADSDGTQATTSGPPPEGGQPLFDGRMTAPEDQTDEEADPAKVQVGKWLSCAVEDASDSDHWSQEDGQPCKTNPDGIEDDGVHYTWTATGGSFEGPLDNEGNPTQVSSIQGQGAKWIAPMTPGKYTISCTIDDTPTPADDPNTEAVETGNRDDDAITRSCVVTVYSFSLRFLESEVAVGAVNNAAHQATYEISASDGTDPVADVEVDEPSILEGTGLGPNDESTASCVKLDDKTDALGKATGTFTSGNRVVPTTIIYEGAQASINQVWSDLSDEEAWVFDPYFDYDVASPITFNMAYSRNGNRVSISGHSVEPATTAISGYEWDEDIGEDYDEDGLPDGDYKVVSYSGEDEDTTKFDEWSGLVEWGTVSDNDGSYVVDQTINLDEDFVLDSVYFWMWDNNSYGPAGAEADD